MDFLERLFGVSPDAGTGATEAGLFLALTVIVLYFVGRAGRRRSGGSVWRRRIEP